MMRTLRPADSFSVRTINQGWEKSCPFIGEAKYKAVQKAGHAGWLDFLKKDHTRDLHAENKDFKVDIMV